MSATVKQSNPNALRSVYERMGEKTKQEVAVGFPEGKTQAYPDGTSVVDVAARHVFGVGVPQRDFMALARDEITKSTAPIIAAAIKAEDPEPLMEAAGMAAAAAIKLAITDLSDPPNAPSTIAAKGGDDNPLIDSAHMKNSVTHVVRDRTK